MKGGTLWDSLTYIVLQNIKKLEGGTLLRHYKIFEKKFSQCRKKLKEGPFGLFRFCRLRKKGKNERGTLCTKFGLAGLGLSKLISFCKKWYIHDEVWSDEKKLDTVIVGLFP